MTVFILQDCRTRHLFPGLNPAKSSFAFRVDFVNFTFCTHKSNFACSSLICTCIFLQTLTSAASSRHHWLYLCHNLNGKISHLAPSSSDKCLKALNQLVVVFFWNHYLWYKQAASWIHFSQCEWHLQLIQEGGKLREIQERERKWKGGREVVDGGRLALKAPSIKCMTVHSFLSKVLIIDSGWSTCACRLAEVSPRCHLYHLDRCSQRTLGFVFFCLDFTPLTEE